MDVRTIARPRAPEDRSCLAPDGESAAVVDPQRDIDRVISLTDELAARITDVTETHIHGDDVSGGLELARTPSADTADRATSAAAGLPVSAGPDPT